MMGEVVQLRVADLTSTDDCTKLVHRESNTETARAVVARPDQHTATDLRAACIWLGRAGDWMDQERARHLLKVLDREQRLQAAADEWSAREKRELCIVGLFVFVCVVGIAMFDSAWGQHLAAGVAR